MRVGSATCLVIGLAALAGCSRQEVAPCMPEARYSTARSAPPVQIPDDLSPPNETDALRLPPETVVSAPIVAGECLETPPPFFGESRPVRSAADDEPGRRARREARRAERRGAEGAETAPAEPREAPAPSSDDRVIDN